MRASWAEVDLAAVAHNVRQLRELVAPAELCAVVKADGYGHGAIAVSEAVLDAGASSLAVALVEEGAVLRKAGIDAPILLLSEPRVSDFDLVAQWGLEPTLYSAAGIDAAAAAARAAGRELVAHLKVNTGMNRVGAEPGDVTGLARRIVDAEGLDFDALWTHCAVADEPGNSFTATQLDRFDAVLAALDREGTTPRRCHAANSAAAIDHPRARMSMVRCGISVYGIPPAPSFADRLDLRPALSLRSEVSHIKRVRAGERISYGLRHTFRRDANVATVPIGYADGVPRRLGQLGGAVLIGGRCRPIVGVVTMDQLMVDCGDDAVSLGDEVVLLGSQDAPEGGTVSITADDWAGRLDTIAYEIVCGIGPRVPRRYRR